MPATTFAFYTVFGGVLASDLVFPELREAPATHAPDWTLHVAAGEPAAGALEPLGERRVGTEQYALYAGPAGLRLQYSHAGTFDVAPSIGSITWYPAPGAPRELARAIVVGPVFALLLEAAGDVCLHGSAVVARDGVLAFLGPKHHGKSTLAFALTAAGCRLVSDDLVAVTPDVPATVRPAIPAMRLWDDAADRLRAGQLGATVVPGIKNTVAGFDASHIMQERAPLAAIYLLAPPDANGGHQEAMRRRLSGAEALVSLAHQRKLTDSLVGYGHAHARLGQSAALAGTVPLYELRVPRNFNLLARIVDQVIAWHGGIPDEPATGFREY